MSGETKARARVIHGPDRVRSVRVDAEAPGAGITREDAIPRSVGWWWPDEFENSDGGATALKGFTPIPQWWTHSRSFAEKISYTMTQETAGFEGIGIVRYLNFAPLPRSVS